MLEVQEESPLFNLKRFNIKYIIESNWLSPTLGDCIFPLDCALVV